MTITFGEASPPLLGSRPTDTLKVGARLSALGAASVTVTSLFYALSPPAAAGPVQPLALAAAMSGALTGAKTMQIAGTVGLVGDLIWAAAALLIAGDLSRRGRGGSAAGWMALFFSITVFALVDGMTGYVLPPLAAAKNAMAFEGMKRLWDMLFVLGVLSYGAGLVSVFALELKSPERTVGRLLCSLLLLIGLVGAADAVAWCSDLSFIPTDKIAGASIGLGSILLIPASLQIGRLRVKPLS